MGESSSRTSKVLLAVKLRQPWGTPKPTLRPFEPVMSGESKTGMDSARKNFHKGFATVSLGFALLGAFLSFAVLPCFAGEGSGTAARSAATKREAAGSQFARAEELRSALNNKPAGKRTLAEYARVATAYRMVYVITPHAMEVPEALLAVGEIYTEMGDRFGRSYYQTSVESYQFLIREYPTSKLVPDAMLRVAKLQKNQIGDINASARSFEEYLKKYPKSPRRREVQEELAELALLRNTAPVERPASAAKTLPPAPRTVEVTAEAAKKDVHPMELHSATKSGGEMGDGDGVPRVEKISMSPTAYGAEVLIDLEDSVEYASGRIADPDRIYFDLHAARLSPNVARGNIHVAGNLLTQVRVAQNQSGVVRVVLDVTGVKDYAVSLMKKPSRLLIELYADKGPIAKPEPLQLAKVPGKSSSGSANGSPNGGPNGIANRVPPPEITQDTTARDSDLATAAAMVPNSPTPPLPPPTTSSTGRAAAANSKSQPASPEGSSSNSVSAKTRGSKSSAKPDLVQPASVPQPMRDGSSSTLTRALGLKIGRIVIDAGHGGHDTGTVGPTGLMEKDLCLDVALRLGRIIQQKLPAADIVYTRADDTFIPLEDRTRIANEAKADLFISIHANSSPDHGARGVETYYLNLQGSADAMEVAARENAAAQQNVHDLEDLVKKIARTEKIGESRELAADIQDSLAKRIQKTAKPVKNRGVRKAPFVVLIGADMPSILTEISFLSNPADEQLLKKPEHRQRVAEGLYAGVIEYLQSMNSVAVNSGGKSARPPVVRTVEQSRNQN
jgi:N-acetylmuramoyl-L-alanine amidase